MTLFLSPETAPAIPVVETERLRLRGATAEDFEGFTACRQSPAVTEQFGGKPPSREECWRKFLTIPGHWALSGVGYWIVEERASGAYVGEVGLADFRREMTPSIEGTLEAGWILSPAFHRRGYGTEAVQASLGWAAAHMPERPVTCIIATTNTASIALAVKCGFTRRCETAYHGDDIVVMDWRG